MDKTGYEEVSTDVLLKLQDNLLRGINLVAKSIEDGTFEVSPKEGSAPPSQAGWLSLTILLQIEDELEARILGFQRSVPV